MKRICNNTLFRLYLHELHVCNYSENTLKTYRSVLTCYGRFLRSKRLTVTTVDRTTICTYRSSIKTIAKRKLHLTVIRQFHQFICALEFRASDPTLFIKLPKTPTITHRPRISIETIRKLKDATTCNRETLIVTLLYDLALRVSEAVHLEIRNICFDSKIITVIGKGNKRRDIHARETVTLIETLADLDNEFLLFSKKLCKKHISTVTCYRLLLDLCARAGVERLTPHDLRHARAEHLRATGVDAFTLKTLLGHSEISTTSLYVNPVVSI